MDNILTLGLTPEEATQIQIEIDQMLAELKRLNEKTAQSHPQIDAWTIRVDRKLAHIDEMLAQLEAKYDA